MCRQTYLSVCLLFFFNVCETVSRFKDGDLSFSCGSSTREEELDANVENVERAIS